MRFEAVTTFSAEGHRAYGRRMLESYNLHWPVEVPIRVYGESTPLFGTCMPEWLFDFQTRHAENRPAHGFVTNGASRGQYNYRFDACRFAYKTAAVIEAIAASAADMLIWIDADTVTHSPVSLAFLESLAPGPGETISWLWRANNYPECGFYMIDLRTTGTGRLVSNWQELYESDRLFHLPEWHDSYVLAQLVATLNLKWKSISGAGEKTGHPFINGPLGAVMDHMKGNRKTAGRSSVNDLRVVRDEPYWRKR